MSVKFVRSSDNKYVQYRYMLSGSFTATQFANTDNWSFCGDDVLVKNPEYMAVYLDAEGRILKAVKNDGTEYFAVGVEAEVLKVLDGAEIHGEITTDSSDTTMIENPEFMTVWLDKDNKILFGVQNDGNFYFGCGMPQQLIDYIEDKLEDLSLDEYGDIVSFLNGLETGNKTLAELLNEKVDKEEGKSLIDEDVAARVHYVENPEFIKVELDSDNRIIKATKNDGTEYFAVGVDIAGAATEYSIENPEFLGVFLDGKNHILMAFENDGNVYYGAGVPKQVKEYIDNEVSLIQDFLAGLDTTTLLEYLNDTYGEYVESPEYIAVETDVNDKILGGRKSDGTKFESVGLETPIVNTNSLQLTQQGMADFQQALRDSHFRPGVADDYTDKDSMYVSEPRLAHLNIISNVNMLTLSKEGMTGAVEGVNYNVPVEVEYFDDKGNYFKKYALLSGQGRSSLRFKKKGLGMDFFNEDPNSPDFDEDNTFKMKFGDWVYQDSFHIKSFYTDWPRCTTPIVYKLTNEILLTRGVMADRPYKKYYVGGYTDSANANSQSSLDKNMETGARCVPDGFPVIVYQNGEFWGVNSWQLKKHRDNYMLSKKKDSNIHLDGYMGYRGGYQTCFWEWNGTIDWGRYCSGEYGIETRNPKNLYCIDGKKYNADTHDAEIITTAIAEEWIAAGQIIPTGKVIDDELAGYLRTTGKVRKNIEDLTTYIPTIQQMVSGGSTTAEIRATIEDMFDVDSFIDYIIIGNVVGNEDAWNNNGQVVTWGKLSDSSILNWSMNVYDCDVTFGCQWDGTYATAANSSKLGYDYPLYRIFWNYYYDDLKARYHELRDKGIVDAEHITGLFRDWMDRVGYDNYKREYTKWSESPCFRDGSQTYTDNPTTGGFYGSIYRIYLWIKKRIEYMDNASFFDYNNQ